jgi:XRE family transcriptional regulator of biofilm formation
MSIRRLKTVLKEMREARGWSQRDLAAKAKVTGAYIAQLETGVRTNPTIDTLRKLAKALKVTVGELVE